MSAADQLRAAKALIDTPEKWTKGVFARDEKGAPTTTGDRTAVCFCSRGAMWRCANLATRNEEKYLDKAVPRKFKTCEAETRYVKFNDAPTTTHADVMKMFDDAITLAEQQS